MQHSRQFLLECYRSMATIRRFEDRVHDEFAAGKIPRLRSSVRGRRGLVRSVSCSQLSARDMIAGRRIAAMAIASPRAVT